MRNGTSKRAPIKGGREILVRDGMWIGYQKVKCDVGRHLCLQRRRDTCFLCHAHHTPTQRIRPYWPNNGNEAYSQQTESYARGKGELDDTDDSVEAKETRTAVTKDGVVIELMRTPTTSPEHVGIMLAQALWNLQIVWILLSDVLADVVIELINGEVLADGFGQRAHQPTNRRPEIMDN